MFRCRAFLAGRPALRAILGNSGWLLADRLLRMAVALLVGAWVARHLGPQRYGELAYGIALVAVWQAFATLGLDSLLVRDLAREPDAAPLLLGTALRLRLASATIGWVGSIVTVALLKPGDHEALAVCALLGAALLFQISDIVDLWFQSQMASRATVLPRSVAYLAASTCKIGLILLDAPLLAFAVVLLLEAMLVAAALTFAYRGRSVARVLGWDAARARALLSESWQLMLAGLSVIVYARVDQLMLSSLAGSRELGLYSAILPLSQGWHIIPMALSASLLPKFSTWWQSDRRVYRQRLIHLYSSFFWFGVAVAGLTSVAAPWLVELLLGQRYAESVAVLRWHAWTNVFVFLGVAQSVAIVGESTPRIALLRTAFGACVSVAANWLLIPRFGAAGAAMAAVAACFSASVLSNAWLAPLHLRLQGHALWPFHASAD